MSKQKTNKIFSLSLSLILIFQQCGFAQVAAQIDLAGHFAKMHQSLVLDRFRPLHLRFFSYDPANDHFELFLDKSGVKDISEAKLQEESRELLKYFLIGITLPDEAFWVNLCPDSPDSIIDPQLATTNIGKVLLEADLELKKDTAKATSPDTKEGREYWDKLYKKAGELLGGENITIPTLTRPWIVPGEVIIRQTETSAYVYKATLKVMLEEDYLKGAVPSSSLLKKGTVPNQVYDFNDPRLKELNEYSTQLIKELIIPKLTQEINSSKRYAALRQVFYSLILARWFKQSFQGKEGLYPNLINKQDLTNLTSTTPWSKETYFQGYQKSFKDGEYNFKEPAYTPFGQVIRSYFSGGMNFGQAKIVTGGVENKAASPVMSGVFANNQDTLGLARVAGRVAQGDILPAFTRSVSPATTDGDIASSPVQRDDTTELIEMAVTMAMGYVDSEDSIDWGRSVLIKKGTVAVPAIIERLLSEVRIAPFAGDVLIEVLLGIGDKAIFKFNRALTGVRDLDQRLKIYIEKIIQEKRREFRRKTSSRISLSDDTTELVGMAIALAMGYAGNEDGITWGKEVLIARGESVVPAIIERLSDEVRVSPFRGSALIEVLVEIGSPALAGLGSALAKMTDPDNPLRRYIQKAIEKINARVPGPGASSPVRDGERFSKGRLEEAFWQRMQYAFGRYGLTTKAQQSIREIEESVYIREDIERGIKVLKEVEEWRRDVSKEARLARRRLARRLRESAWEAGKEVYLVTNQGKIVSGIIESLGFEDDVKIGFRRVKIADPETVALIRSSEQVYFKAAYLELEDAQKAVPAIKEDLPSKPVLPGGLVKMTAIDTYRRGLKKDEERIVIGFRGVIPITSPSAASPVTAEQLVGQLDSPDSTVRVQAAKGLGEMGRETGLSTEVFSILIKTLYDSAPAVKDSAEQALAVVKINDLQVFVSSLLKSLQDSSEYWKSRWGGRDKIISIVVRRIVVKPQLAGLSGEGVNELLKGLKEVLLEEDREILQVLDHHIADALGVLADNEEVDWQRLAAEFPELKETITALANQPIGRISDHSLNLLARIQAAAQKILGKIDPASPSAASPVQKKVEKDKIEVLSGTDNSLVTINLHNSLAVLIRNTKTGERTIIHIGDEIKIGDIVSLLEGEGVLDVTVIAPAFPGGVTYQGADWVATPLSPHLVRIIETGKEDITKPRERDEEFIERVTFNVKGEVRIIPATSGKGPSAASPVGREIKRLTEELGHHNTREYAARRLREIVEEGGVLPKETISALINALRDSWDRVVYWVRITLDRVTEENPQAAFSSLLEALRQSPPLSKRVRWYVISELETIASHPQIMSLGIEGIKELIITTIAEILQGEGEEARKVLVEIVKNRDIAWTELMKDLEIMDIVRKLTSGKIERIADDKIGQGGQGPATPGAASPVEKKEKSKRKAIKRYLSDLSDGYYQSRRDAETALERLGATRKDWIKGYTMALSYGDGYARGEALHALRKLEATPEELIAGYTQALESPDSGARYEAEEALRKLNAFDKERELTKLIADLENKSFTSEELKRLAELKDPRAVEPLIRLLPDVEVMNTLAAIGDRRAIEPLLGYLGHYFYDIRTTAKTVLKKLGATRKEWKKGYEEASMSYGRYYSADREDRRIDGMAEDLRKLKKEIDKIPKGSGGPAAASPVTAKPETPGGIDLTRINLICEPMGNFAGLALQLPKITDLENFSFSEKLTQIKNLLLGQNIPNGDRFNELLSVCYAKMAQGTYLTEIIATLLDSCRIEEELALESSPETRGAILLAEAM